MISMFHMGHRLTQGHRAYMGLLGHLGALSSLKSMTQLCPAIRQKNFKLLTAAGGDATQSLCVSSWHKESGNMSLRVGFLAC